MRSLAEAMSSNQNIRTLWLFNNPITVDGARLIMKAAVDNAMCEVVKISSEYYDDDEVKRMKNILDDRRKQDVRSYFNNVANNYCYAYGNTQVMKTPVKMMIVLKRSH